MEISKCRGCDADIIWIQTAKGKTIPLDAETIKAYYFRGDKGIWADVHIQHWSNCPDADRLIGAQALQFRKIKK